MLNQGIIEPSNSPWMAPAVYRRKRSGEVRICVDYRELNKRTGKDAYPLPLPDDVFDRISGAKVFSTLDMQSGFWQVPVSPQDVQKTAFSPGPANSAAPNPSKVSAIASWPIPADRKVLKRFLRLTSYYRRFVPDYATVSVPLYNLLREDTVFHWTNACQVAFDNLKKLLTTAPFLTPPNFRKPFELMTDASDTGLGAVLEQHGRVVAFASRSLTRSERNYSTIEKECLGIVFALKTFHHYLLARSFTIFTDHACHGGSQHKRWTDVRPVGR
ncbi:hypothetical protein D918_09398 [Trichuris suis]|nr:hypothetical protein D918_09398 [Trichuris suis]